MEEEEEEEEWKEEEERKGKAAWNKWKTNAHESHAEMGANAIWRDMGDSRLENCHISTVSPFHSSIHSANVLPALVATFVKCPQWMGFVRRMDAVGAIGEFAPGMGMGTAQLLKGQNSHFAFVIEIYCFNV